MQILPGQNRKHSEVCFSLKLGPWHQEGLGPGFSAPNGHVSAPVLQGPWVRDLASLPSPKGTKRTATQGSHSLVSIPETLDHLYLSQQI